MYVHSSPVSPGWLWPNTITPSPSSELQLQALLHYILLQPQSQRNSPNAAISPCLERPSFVPEQCRVLRFRILGHSVSARLKGPQRWWWWRSGGLSCWEHSKTEKKRRIIDYIPRSSTQSSTKLHKVHTGTHNAPVPDQNIIIQPAPATIRYGELCCCSSYR